LLCVLLVPIEGESANFDTLFYGTNDFGGVGLMQTPTARMRPDGEFGLGVGTVMPYNDVYAFVQPLPWFEAVVRETDLTDVLYSTDPSFSGGQHDKDLNADFKLRLMNEGQYRPALAVGLQEFAGTGLFASEYFVSSYHYYDFDFSFGLAWGRLGSGGNIYNPFRLISNHFTERSIPNGSVSQSGSIPVDRWFTGRTIGAFGGVEWNTPIKGLALRMEYDANDYQHEPLNANLRQDSHINYGLSYRGIKSVEMGVGLERGNTVMGRLAIYTNFQQLRGVAKSADPQVPAVAPVSYVGAASTPAPNDTSAAAAPARFPVAATPPVSLPLPAQGVQELPAPQRHAFILKLRAALKEQGFVMIAADYIEANREVRVWLSQDKYRNPAKATGRTARVLSATAPEEVSKFTLIFVDGGVESYRAEVSRADFEKAARGQAGFDTALSSVRLTGPGDGFGGAEYFDPTRLPKFSWDMGPAVRQSVGGPNGVYFGQLYWKVGAGLQVTDHLDISAAAGFNIVNNFNKITLQSNSTLPHVRSDIVDYLQQGANGVLNLESDYIWSPHPDWYHRMSVGIFEEMYGGVATELLYRPYGRSWAVAFDINRVKQRGFDEMFDFLPYEATTGHVELYYKPGFYNLLFKLSAGQYLARDRGATLDISRQFDSGVRVGVFATKTNVTAAEFGEGSFDKGVYLTLPLDLFFAQSTRREAGFVFRPLTRDGGQTVYDGPELYYVVEEGQPDQFARGASELLK
jgi:hypothetical protein